MNAQTRQNIFCLRTQRMDIEQDSCKLLDLSSAGNEIRYPHVGCIRLYFSKKALNESLEFAIVHSLIEDTNMI